jgi:hypothetical protein
LVLRIALLASSRAKEVEDALILEFGRPISNQLSKLSGSPLQPRRTATQPISPASSRAKSTSPSHHQSVSAHERELGDKHGAALITRCESSDGPLKMSCLYLRGCFQSSNPSQNTLWMRSS